MDRMERETRIMLGVGKALFLGCGDYFALANECGGTIVLECGYAEYASHKALGQSLAQSVMQWCRCQFPGDPQAPAEPRRTNGLSQNLGKARRVVMGIQIQALFRDYSIARAGEPAGIQTRFRPLKSLGQARNSLCIVAGCTVNLKD